jgi:CheY-like chemotaxis protein
MVLRVLVAEDEALIAYELSSIVEQAGYSVVGPCATLGHVQEAAAANSPELALIDIRLGQDSGTDVCAYLHAHYRTTCVYLTAYSSHQIGESLGALGLFRKPFYDSHIPGLLRYMEARHKNHNAECPRLLTLFDPGSAALSSHQLKPSLA